MSENKEFKSFSEELRFIRGSIDTLATRVSCIENIMKVDIPEPKIAQITEPEPKHRYIESAEDIVPWQFYVIDGDLVKILLNRYNTKTYSVIGADDTHCVYDSIFSLDMLKGHKAHIAEISEIPEHCLIGKMVRAWDDGTRCVEGILTEINEERKYRVDFKNGVIKGIGLFNNIELINHAVNYS